MKRLLPCILFFFSFLFPALAKDKYDMSVATGIGEVGINKVLCMKNGYTLLFHFEINKPITLAVFDSLHKRVANTHPNCELLNLAMLTTTLFKGMYEINGQAVLFFEQQNSGRHTLIRMRFDPIKGRLIDEEVIGKSHGLAKHMKFFVMRYKGEEGYEVLLCEDIMQFKESKIEVKYFSAKHEVYKTVPLVLDRKKYDYLNVVGAESMPQGVCVSLALSNMLVNGTGSTIATMPVYNHYLHVFYIPKDGMVPKQHIADLSTSYTPYYTTCAYNPFAEKVNLMLFSFTDALYQSGIDTLPTALVSNLLFKLDEQTFTANYNWITNEHANAIITANKLAKKKEIDTEATYKGFPVKMVTNSNGLSTLVSESYERYKNVESYLRSRVYETYLGDISITQFDDDGKELWGIVLPKTQYFKSYRNYYHAADMAKRWQQQAMFDDRPPQIFDRQFMSMNVYNTGSNFYIIFNDGTKNMGNSIGEPGDTVFTSALSNACYYKINKKKEIEKGYLLGEPLPKEYKSSFIEGADFDEQRSVYATLVRYKRGEYVSIRMAWVKMD